MSRPEDHLQPPDDEGDIVDQQAMDAAAGPAGGGTTLAGTMQSDEDDAEAGGGAHPATHQGTQSAGEALSGEHGAATSPATPTPAADPGSGGSSGA